MVFCFEILAGASLDLIWGWGGQPAAFFQPRSWKALSPTKTPMENMMLVVSVIVVAVDMLAMSTEIAFGSR